MQGNRDIKNFVEQLVSFNRSSELAVPSGYSGLDKAIGGGFQPGTVTVVSARTSCGKSAFCHNVARHIASGRRSVLFVSLETPTMDVFARILSQITGIQYWTIVERKFNDGDYNELCAAAVAIESLNVHSGLLDNATELWALVAMHKPHVLFIDNLSFLPKDPLQDRDTQTAASMQLLKEVAVRCKIPVIVTAHLNRESLHEVSRAQLSDLRGAGFVESLADNVIFLHQSENYLGKSTDVELILRKNRNGETGHQKLWWTPETFRFYDMPPIDTEGQHDANQSN